MGKCIKADGKVVKLPQLPHFHFPSAWFTRSVASTSFCVLKILQEKLFFWTFYFYIHLWTTTVVYVFRNVENVVNSRKSRNSSESTDLYKYKWAWRSGFPLALSSLESEFRNLIQVGLYRITPDCLHLTTNSNSSISAFSSCICVECWCFGCRLIFEYKYISRSSTD